MFKKRILEVQKNLANPILIKKKENLLYLTGYSFDYRSQEYLLVKPLTPSFAKASAGRPALSRTGRGRTADVVGFGSGLEKLDWAKKADQFKNIGKYLKPKSHLGVEWGFTLGELKYLKSKILGLRAKPERSPVDVMRLVKDADEIGKIKKSMEIVGKVFALVKKEIKKAGMTEIRLAQFIQNTGFKLGAEDISFPAIVASGANAAVPHHVPSSKRLKPEESIIIDFGFKYKHYCSDFTRTVFLKNAPKKLAEAYNQTEKAYNGSIEFINQSLNLRGVQPTKQSRSSERLPRLSDALNARNYIGPSGNDIYQRSVDILAEKHLDKYFIHSLGHGTGLEIHELPNLSPQSKDILQNGMVFSIEPGVYFPGVGGIRIEDLVYLEGGKVRKFINVSTKIEDNIL